MAFVQTDVNYATQYASELANAYPYLSYFGDIYGGENATKYRPIMGKSVAIPSLTVSGAKDVNRDSIDGQFSRNWNNAWQTVTMEMDREWDTLIDPLDIVETNDVATIANVTKTFNEQMKIPEMDAYLVSKLAAAVADVPSGEQSPIDMTELTAANILTAWDGYLEKLAEARINRDRVICYLTPTTYKLLKEAAGITRFIDVATGIRNVDRNVGKLDGVRLVEVPSDLMKDSYTFTEGFTPAAGAAQINLIFIDPLAVVAPVVYDTSMISAPTAATKGKYIYYERFYYDVFLLDNRKSGVIINETANDEG